MVCENCLKKEFCAKRGMTETIEKALKPHENVKMQCKAKLTILPAIAHIIAKDARA